MPIGEPGNEASRFDSCGCGCGCGYEMVWVYGYRIVVKGGYDHRRVSGCGWVGREWVWVSGCGNRKR